MGKHGGRTPYCWAWLFTTWMLMLCTVYRPATSQNDGDLRLTGLTSTGSLKQLEIYHSGSWGPVCAQNWGPRESLVVCRQLGSGFVGNWDRDAAGTVTSAKLGEVRCDGSEGSILDCQHSQLGIGTDCSEGLVTVYCTEYAAGTVLLSDGESFAEGRVEIRLEFGNKTFIYTICDEEWDLADAQVACKDRQDPYDSALEAVRGSYFGEHPPSGISPNEQFDGFLISAVRCNSSLYDRVLRCPNAGWFPKTCPSGKSAGVKCKKFADTFQVNVALSGGSSQYNGVVKATINADPSGSICDGNQDWSLREGDVVCRSLGFGYALNVSVVTTTLEPTVNNVRCDGNELSLSECTRGGPCQSRADLAPTVNCSGPLDSSDHPLEITNGQGSRSHKGLLRVYRDGRWGTVCNTGWTKKNAEVACRQLGYASVVSYLDKRNGLGPIYLSNVGCTGTEKQLDQCEHSGWGVNDGCSHEMDVALECGTAAVAVNSLLIGALVSIAKLIISNQ